MSNSNDEIISRCDAALAALRSNLLQTEEGSDSRTSKLRFGKMIWTPSPEKDQATPPRADREGPGSGPTSMAESDPLATRAARYLEELEEAVAELMAQVKQLRYQKEWSEAAYGELSEKLVAVHKEKRLNAMALSKADAEIARLEKALAERAKASAHAPEQPGPSPRDEDEICYAVDDLSSQMDSLQQGNMALRADLEAAEARIAAMEKQQRIVLEALNNDGQVRKLGELLVAAGVVSQGQLEEALQQQAASPKRRVGAILLEKGHTGEDEIAQTVACQLNLPLVYPNQETLNPEAARMLAEDICIEHQCVALRSTSNRVFVAMANPQDQEAIDIIEHSCGREVVPLVATPSGVASAIRSVFNGRQLV